MRISRGRRLLLATSVAVFTAGTIVGAAQAQAAPSPTAPNVARYEQARAQLQARTNAEKGAPAGTLAAIDRGPIRDTMPDAYLSHAKIVPPPAGIVPKLISAPSGHTPYGGSKWASKRIDGRVDNCSGALATRSSDGRQFFYTAGHCLMNDTGGQFTTSTTSGQFWYPECGTATNPCPVSPTLGNTGHGGTHFDSVGDQAFIRANIAWGGTGLRREVGTFDTRQSVAVTFVGNPTQNEIASCACGQSRRLIHGFVSYPNLGPTVVGAATVGNLAILQIQVRDEGCPIQGDSGSTIITSDHGVIGTASAVAHDEVNCWLWFGKAGSALNSVNQFAAPAP